MRLWRYEDAEAYKDGRPLAAHRPLVAGTDYFTRKMVGLKLGKSMAQFDYWRRSKTQIPPPTGQISGTSYWLPSDLERWQAVHDVPNEPVEQIGRCSRSS